MKLTAKEAALCAGGGTVISLIVFVAAFLICPTVFANGAFWLIVGLLPMILITGIYLNRREALENRDPEDSKKQQTIFSSFFHVIFVVF